MIRNAVPADTSAILALGVDTALFRPEEVAPVHAMLDGFFGDQLGAGHGVVVWVEGTGGPPLGVAYFGPDGNTDRKWDLWMIAVAPAHQGRGIGGELLRSAETHARSGDGRLLLIETSSLQRFDATHAFYRKHGYAEVARIPDYYRDGDSKVIFAKRLCERT